jgi:hypothetical protein
MAQGYSLSEEGFHSVKLQRAELYLDLMYVLHKRQHSEHADGETMETTV